MRVLYPIKEGSVKNRCLIGGGDSEGAPYGVRERELACLAKRRDNDGVGKSIKNQAGVWRETLGGTRVL